MINTLTLRLIFAGLAAGAAAPKVARLAPEFGGQFGQEDMTPRVHVETTYGGQFGQEQLTGPRYGTSSVKSKTEAAPQAIQRNPEADIRAIDSKLEGVQEAALRYRIKHELDRIEKNIRSTYPSDVTGDDRTSRCGEHHAQLRKMLLSYAQEGLNDMEYDRAKALYEESGKCK